MFFHSIAFLYVYIEVFANFKNVFYSYSLPNFSLITYLYGYLTQFFLPKGICSRRCPIAIPVPSLRKSTTEVKVGATRWLWFLWTGHFYQPCGASQVVLVVSYPLASARDMRRALGRSPGGGHGNPLWYCYLENRLDKGAWWATVHVVTESQTRLKWLSTHAHTHLHCSDRKLSSHMFRGLFPLKPTLHPDTSVSVDRVSKHFYILLLWVYFVNGCVCVYMCVFNFNLSGRFCGKWSE